MSLNIEVGELYELVASLESDDVDWTAGGENSRKCTWTSSDTSVVGLNVSESIFWGGIATGNGIRHRGYDSVSIRGISVGTATITVRLDNGNEVSCVVTVK